MQSAKIHPNPTIAVVIPCYRVVDHILSVIAGIGPEVSQIIVVDDACPDGSGRFVQERCRDARVVVEFLPNNLGVGGAVLAGYRRAIESGAGIIVKLDGDGQMDPALIPRFIAPILEGEADYTKGNRFFDLESLRSMPVVRLIGNAGLSFISKLSSGYWKVMDPTNGFTAIDARIAANLPHSKIASRYFFESDMLFRLNTLQAAIVDIPMDAVYGTEKSNLKIRKVLFEFPLQHAVCFCKRIFYSYFLRDFNAASVELVAGTLLTASGTIFGITQWIHFSELRQPAPTGTVLLATIQVIVGVQLLLSWITFDLNSTPQKPISGRLGRTSSKTRESSAVAITPANNDAFAKDSVGRAEAV
ncbi:MAG: glycosyltransferase family 2 protein [Pseudomonadota bacterium]|jgi:dolichol-phosphate mannosyltransferase